MFFAFLDVRSFVLARPPTRPGYDEVCDQPAYSNLFLIIAIRIRKCNPFRLLRAYRERGMRNGSFDQAWRWRERGVDSVATWRESRINGRARV